MKSLKRRPRAFLRLLVAFLSIAWGAAVEAQTNQVLLISPAGEYIGAGQTYYTTNETNIVIVGTPETVTVQAFGFNVIFDAPGPSVLTVGSYSNAVQYPSNGNAPGFAAFGNGRSCTNVCANFQILELGTNASGQVARFWATFLQHCECTQTPPLTGEIRYHSQLAQEGPLPRTLLVPADYPSIQSALNNVNRLAVDTILVQPGIYHEALQFGTNSAHVVSAAGPALTFIEAPGSAAVSFGVDFKDGTVDALLQGFTLTNSAFGVHVAGGFSPKIVSNVIVNCGTGIDLNPLGIGRPASAIIHSNIIKGCPGWAMQLFFTEAPLLEGNRLEGNGGGISLWSAGTPDIRSNIIISNRGDGVAMANQYGVNIIQNLIIGNTGIGLALGKPQGGLRGPWAINNTIVDNGGAGIATSQFANEAEVINNIVVGDPPLQLGQGNFQFNNFYPSRGGVLSGSVTNLIGFAGNISTNPYLVCQPGLDYHLLPGSPCIDAGTNGAPLMPGTDFDGSPRIVVGNTNGSLRVDMGAFEFNHANPVACLFLSCPTNLVVIAPPGENSTLVTYPSAFATPGAVISNWPPSGSLFPAGDNPVNVTATYGTNILNCVFTISVLTTNDFPRAVNATNLAWTTVGNAPWFVQNTVTRDGLAAAQSGSITNGQTSTLETLISGPATLNFWWKVSSEANHDFLSVAVNGMTAASISGGVDWRQQTVYLGSGTQLVQWTFAKDANVSAGLDAAWVDLVSITPEITPPFFSSAPVALAVAPGQTATFSVDALGTPPLAFQWAFNGTHIAGATGSSLTITNVRNSSVGTYFLTVTNSGGSTNGGMGMLMLSEVVSWGLNSYGQTNVPLIVTNVLAVAGGNSHSLALRADGKVVAWGRNDVNQTNVPLSVSNIVAIASRSGSFSMALRSNGTVVVWGNPSFGVSSVPPTATNVVAISAGLRHCLALKANGVPLSWGFYGNSTIPPGLSNVTAIAAGVSGSLALNAAGIVIGWGAPTAPPGLSNIMAIALGAEHGLALQQAGTVLTWGSNLQGQTNVPIGLSNVVAIAAGDYHSSALRANGTVVTWGSYRNGAGGYLPAMSMPGLSNVISIAAGADHDLALLGQGPQINQALPTSLSFGSNVFSMKLPTQSGRIYSLEFRESLNHSNWNLLTMVAGDGTEKTFADTNATNTHRFYRVRRW